MFETGLHDAYHGTDAGNFVRDYLIFSKVSINTTLLIGLTLQITSLA